MSELTIRFAKPNEAGLVLDFIKKIADYEKLLDEVVCDESTIYDSVFVKKEAEVIFACEDGIPVGFALFFHNFSTFMGKKGLYLEDLFVIPEKRGKGYGKSALDLLKEKGKIILLEIEPPINGITQRRYNFYKRNGFAMNPYYHIQAKYHPGDADLELKVLTYPRVMEKEEYRLFYEYMTREIGINPSESKD